MRRRVLGAAGILLIAVVLAWLVRERRGVDAPVARAVVTEAGTAPRTRSSAPDADAAPGPTTPPPLCRDSVAGTVRDAAGGPIAGATLTASVWPEEVETESDARGAYKLCAPDGRQGASLLRIEADGYATVAEEIGLYGEGRRDVVLVPEATLGGRVVDGRGALVPDATVTATAFAAPGRPRMVPAPDGRFSLDGLRKGGYFVSASTETLATVQPTSVRVAPGLDTEIELRVVPAPIVRVILEETGGGPLPQTPIRFRYDETPHDFVTDAHGEVAIRAPHNAMTWIEVKGWALRDARYIQLRPRKEAIHIRVERGATLAGRVLRAGKPEAYVQVNAQGPRGNFPAFTTAETDGTFELVGLPAGRFELHATSRDTLAYAKIPMEIAAGERRTGIVVNLDYDAQVSGVVVDAQGAPVAGVLVQLQLVGGNDQGRGGTRADGTFLAGGLTGGGEYAVTVSRGEDLAPLRAADSDGLPPIHVADGHARVAGIRLVIDGSRFSIAGVVRRPDGSPVADASVMAVAENGRPAANGAVTDARGAFEIGGLDDGAYVLAVTAGTLVVSGTKAHTGRPVVIRLPEVGGIHGRLVGFSGPPAVWVNGDQDPFVEVSGNELRATEVATGTYRVGAGFENESAAATIDVTAGQVTEVTLTALPPGHVEGRLVDVRTGKGQEGLVCRSLGASGPTDALPVGADGRFAIGLPAGPQRLACGMSDPTWIDSWQTFTVVAGETVNVTIKGLRLRMPRRDDRPFMPTSAVGPLIVKLTAPGSPFLPDDQILAVDGVDATELSAAVAYFLILDRPAGETARLQIRRGDRTMKLDYVVPPPP